MKRLKRLCQSIVLRRYPAVPVLLALLLTAPSLCGGLQFDDFSIRAAILDQFAIEEITPNPWAPFSFLDGRPEHNRLLIDRGFVPWWTDLECRAAFMRPLTALTHMIDYYLLDGLPVLMHLQSLLWFALLVWAAAVLYRRLLSREMPVWTAALAALLFAVDDAHGAPAGWLANRNAVLAALFGVLAVILHDRWRRDAWQPGMVLAPAAFLIGLLCKESATSVGAYLLGYALFLDRAHWGRRVASLVTYVVIGAIWYAFYQALEFGISRSGVYIDPADDFLGFLAQLVDNAPILLLGQWGFPSADLHPALSASGITVHWLWALVFLALVTVLLVPLLIHSKVARFFTCGMLLSLVPACLSFPSDRLLMFVGLGGMGLLAQLLGGLTETASWLPARAAWRRLARVSSIFFIAIHLVIAPLLLPVLCVAMKLLGRPTVRLVETLPNHPKFEQQTIILVNSISWLVDSAVFQRRYYLGKPLPRRLLNLSSSSHPASLTRIDARTLAVRPQGGYLLPRGRAADAEQASRAFSYAYFFQYLDRLFRSDTHPLRLGERIELADLTIEITALTEDQRAAEATFRFSVPLEDATLCWLEITEDGFAPFTPPTIGRTVEVPSPLPALGIP